MFLPPILILACTSYSLTFLRIHSAYRLNKEGRRNIINLRYADDTTLMAESEKEVKSLLMRVKEESERANLKLNMKKTKNMTSGPII